MIKTIKKSMKYGQLLQIIYLSDDGVVTKRVVYPIKLSSSALYAYCYLRQSRRTFKVTNVLALVPIIKKEGMVV